MECFVQFVKLDEERRLIHGRAVEKMPDRSQRILDYDSAKPAFRDWSKAHEDATGGRSKGNVRAMHGTLVAGKVVELAFNDAEKAIDIVVKVVDDHEWRKCVEGCYTGFSVGSSTARTGQDGADTRYTPAVTELSLVDRPGIPLRFFNLRTADSSVGVTAKVAEATVNAGKAVHGAETATELRAANIAAAKKETRFRDALDDKFFDSEGKLRWPEERKGFAGGVSFPKMLEGEKPGRPETVIDRYSYEEGELDRGNYFSPVGTPYEARSLPYDREKMVYTRYRVLKDFEVEAGTATPAFNQVGGGMQYYSRMRVQKLIHDGFIEEIK